MVVSDVYNLFRILLHRAVFTCSVKLLVYLYKYFQPVDWQVCIFNNLLAMFLEPVI